MKKKINHWEINRLFPLFSKELNSKRIFGLDLLRAYAIVIVMIGHGQFLLPKKIKDLHQYINFDGVSIFFVLSGFLIGGILIRQLEIHPPGFNVLFDFWIRRWMRTLPTYFLILILLTISYYLSDPSFSYEQILKYYFFSQTLFREPSLIYFKESWSVEEWFYVLVPLFIFLFVIIFKMRIRKSVIAIVVLVLVTVTFMRYSLYLRGDSLDFHHKVFFRLDSIMYGFFGSYIHYYHKRWWDYKPMAFFGCGLAIFIIQKYIIDTELFSESFYAIVVGYSLPTSLGTLLLLPFLSGLKEAKYKIGKLITIISLISYSMYLTHMSLIKDFILKKIPWTDYTTNYNIIMPVNYFLYWALTFIVSIFIYRYFEVPTTKLRDKLQWDRMGIVIKKQI